MSLSEKDASYIGDLIEKVATDNKALKDILGREIAGILHDASDSTIDDIIMYAQDMFEFMYAIDEELDHIDVFSDREATMMYAVRSVIIGSSIAIYKSKSLSTDLSNKEYDRFKNIATRVYPEIENVVSDNKKPSKGDINAHLDWLDDTDLLSIMSDEEEGRRGSRGSSRDSRSSSRGSRDSRSSRRGNSSRSSSRGSRRNSRDDDDRDDRRGGSRATRSSGNRSSRRSRGLADRVSGGSGEKPETDYGVASKKKSKRDDRRSDRDEPRRNSDDVVFTKEDFDEYQDKLADEITIDIRNEVTAYDWKGSTSGGLRNAGFHGVAVDAKHDVDVSNDKLLVVERDMENYLAHELHRNENFASKDNKVVIPTCDFSKLNEPIDVILDNSSNAIKFIADKSINAKEYNSIPTPYKFGDCDNEEYALSVVVNSMQHSINETHGIKVNTDVTTFSDIHKLLSDLKAYTGHPAIIAMCSDINNAATQAYNNYLGMILSDFARLDSFYDYFDVANAAILKREETFNYEKYQNDFIESNFKVTLTHSPEAILTSINVDRHIVTISSKFPIGERVIRFTRRDVLCDLQYEVAKDFYTICKHASEHRNTTAPWATIIIADIYYSCYRVLVSGLEGVTRVRASQY